MTTTETKFRTFEQYGWICTNRYLGRCRSCKTVARILNDSPFEEIKVQCECGQWVKVSRVIAGRDSKKECNARCTGAVGPACDCKCRGENHGGR